MREHEDAEDPSLFAAMLEDGDDAEESDARTLWREAVASEYALPFPLPALGLTARPYQTDAVEAWERNEGRGMVVLPTGAGKTVVALMAMARMQVRTLVVVPTIDLLHQWHGGICARFGLEPDAVGMVGGGVRRSDWACPPRLSAAMGGMKTWHAWLARPCLSVSPHL